MSSIPIVVGRFGKTFGVMGWIKVVSFTSPQENILNLQPWLIQKGGSWVKISLEDSKKNSGNVVVKLPAYNSPEEVSNLTNVDIGIWQDQLPELSSDEYYWMDLIGLDVINKEEVDFGKVKDLLSTGSNDVLVVEGDKKRLIPYISNVITNVDLKSRIIKVDWPEDF